MPAPRTPDRTPDVDDPRFWRLNRKITRARCMMERQRAWGRRWNKWYHASQRYYRQLGFNWWMDKSHVKPGMIFAPYKITVAESCVEPHDHDHN
jgi:hypothetical protein